MKKLILDDGINWNLTIQRNTIDSQRKALNKELKNIVFKLLVMKKS